MNRNLIWQILTPGFGYGRNTPPDAPQSAAGERGGEISPARSIRREFPANVMYSNVSKAIHIRPEELQTLGAFMINGVKPYSVRRGGRLYGLTLVLASVSMAGFSMFAPITQADSARPVFHPLNLNSPAVVAKIDLRANAIIKRLTLDEKIKLLAERGWWYTAGVKRAGIPVLRFSDASVGVRAFGPSTAYPASEALAASWDNHLAYLTGRALGSDARARGVNMLLGPGMNVVREPQGGRNFEFLGEDPYLAGHIATPWIRGLQSMDVAACAKHYVGNEQETDRVNINCIIGMRALHEIYLPPFRDAVKRGNVMMFMAAFNKVNGVYCCENPYLLTTVLRDRWGYRGMVQSDGGATHSTLRSLDAGLDVENPTPHFYTAKFIKPLLKSGKLKISVLNEHLRRLLRMIIAMNFLRGHQKDATIPLDDPRSRAIAMRIEAEGSVLLKNVNNILPLDRSSVKTIVVVGPNATPAVTGGGGSSYTDPIHSPVSMLEAIKTEAGPKTKVICFPYTGIERLNPQSAYLPIDGIKGLEATYYRSTDFSGKPVAKVLVKQINFNWQNAHPVPQIHSVTFSARYIGAIKPSRTGNYWFSIGSDDGGRVYLDGKLIIDNWGNHAITYKNAMIHLTAGTVYHLRIDYNNLGGLAELFFSWSAEGSLFTPHQASIIRHAGAVIACVGPHESEGSDRGFRLPDNQDGYLAALGALNHRTIVVVNAGDNIAMSRWIHRVDGLVYAWYPGENGNTAVAQILFGALNPSGRLPESFAKHWKDAAAYGHFPGHDGQVHFAEGIYVGYRWFDKKHITPRFAFGYGLSYTTFSLSGLTVKSAGAGKTRIITVKVTVTNTGRRAGAQVVQIYVHPPQNSGVERCVQNLKGYARVLLQTGQSRTVIMNLHWKDFAYFDTATNQWTVPPGIYEIAAGSSSRDEPLHRTVAW